MKILSFVFVFVTAASLAAQPELTWKQTDTSLALMRGEQAVWKFNYQKEEGKPYFHPLTVAGSGPLTDLRPADHYWHRALWFSWKAINGLNYWEEEPKTGKAQGQTEVVNAKATSRPDHSARFDILLELSPASQSTRLDGNLPD